MRCDRRFASYAVGVGIVVCASMLIFQVRSLHAQRAVLVAQKPLEPVQGSNLATNKDVTDPTPLSLPLPLDPGPADPKAGVEASVPRLPRGNGGIAPPPGPFSQARETNVPPEPAADPEKDAEAYVCRSRHEAETRIKALNAEAEQLTARLKKVQAAIKRWETLRAALDVKDVVAEREGNFPGEPVVAKDRFRSDPRAVESLAPTAIDNATAADPPVLESIPAPTREKTEPERK